MGNRRDSFETDLAVFRAGLAKMVRLIDLEVATWQDHNEAIVLHCAIRRTEGQLRELEHEE